MDKTVLELRIELSQHPLAGEVLVTNRSAKTISVWNLGNEWGDDALSFLLQTDSILIVERQPQIYTRNTPSTVTLHPNESHRWRFDLRDGSWDFKAETMLPSDVTLVAVYDCDFSEEALKAGVWIGRVASRPVAVHHSDHGVP